MRLDLDASSPRCLAVLEPLRVVLDNLPADYHTAVQGRVSLSPSVLWLLQIAAPELAQACRVVIWGASILVMCL